MTMLQHIDDWVTRELEDPEFMKRHGIEVSETPFPVDEIVLNEVRLTPWDVQLSLAMKAWNIFPPTIQSAVWELASQPSALLMSTMQSFVNTEVIQEVIKGTIAPQAHLGLVTGEDTLVTTKNDDVELDIIQKMLSSIADDKLQSPEALINLHTVDGQVVKRLQNKTVIETHFVQTMLLSTTRLTYNDPTKSRFIDLAVGMTTDLSFDEFSLIQDKYRVVPDQMQGINVVIDDDPIHTHSLQVLLKHYLLQKPILKTSFSQEEFRRWSEFLTVMDEERQGFSQLMLALVFPGIVPFMIAAYRPPADFTQLDCSLIPEIVGYLDDQDEVPPDPDLNSQLVHEMNLIDARYTVPVLQETLGVTEDGYGKMILYGEKGYEGANDNLADALTTIIGVESTTVNTVWYLARSALRASEILRVLRAQDDYQRDEETNRAADAYVGDYEQLYYQKWKNLTSRLQDLSSVYLVGEITSFPYLKDIIGADKVQKTSFSFLPKYQPNFHGNKMFFIDLADEKFDSLLDKSVPTRFSKTWTKGYPSPASTRNLFATFTWMMQIRNQMVSSDRIEFFLKVPIPHCWAVMKLYSLLIEKMQMEFSFMLPKKSHDPFFLYVPLKSTAPA